MNEKLVKLATKLGLDPEALTDEDVAYRLIEQAIDALKERAKGEEKPPEGDKEASLSGDVKALPSPLLVSTVADNRKMKLESLLAQGCITPAMRDNIAKQYIGSDNAVICAALTAGDNITDGFDFLVGTLSANKGKFAAASQTGAQSLDLPDSRKAKDEKPAIVANAEARAAAAEQAESRRHR